MKRRSSPADSFASTWPAASSPSTSEAHLSCPGDRQPGCCPHEQFSRRVPPKARRPKAIGYYGRRTEAEFLTKSDGSAGVLIFSNRSGSCGFWQVGTTRQKQN